MLSEIKYRSGLTGITRINVVGTSGSGKSTFSKRLSEIMKIPYVEMDKVYWGPKWHGPPDEEFFPKLESAVDMEHWVLDGNYTRTTPIKWKSVQMVIWLDFPFATTFFRVFKRTMFRVFSKYEIWEGTGNRESILKTFFHKDSMLWWTTKTYSDNRKKYNSIMHDEKYAYIKFVKLSGSEEVEAFLKEVEKAIQ